MRRIILLSLCSLMLASCGILAPTDLYSWGGESSGVTKYEEVTYRDYKNQSPEALCQMLCAYQTIVSSPGGIRQIPPPGVCAEYGYLLLQPQTAATFAEKASDRQKAVFKDGWSASAFAELGREMLQKETELYPESLQFLGPLISKLAQQP